MKIQPQWVVRPEKQTKNIHILNFAVIILGILLTSVGNSGPKLRRSEEPVKRNSKTERNVGQQYHDIFYLIR
jgi:hypothetical protein